MTFPLEYRELIRGFKAHQIAGLDGAADYVADYKPLYAPVSGKVDAFSGVQGGNWLRIRTKDGRSYEFAHLSEYIVSSGDIEEGKLIAITGNTGTVTTGPHLHVQIKDSRGRRLDPESVFKKAVLPVKDEEMTEDQKVANLLPILCERWETYHGRKLDGKEFDSIERESRKVIRGEINLTDLLKRWAKGQ